MKCEWCGKDFNRGKINIPVCPDNDVCIDQYLNSRGIVPLGPDVEQRVEEFIQEEEKKYTPHKHKTLQELIHEFFTKSHEEAKEE